MDNIFHCAIFSVVARERGVSGCGVCLLFPMNEVLLIVVFSVTDGLYVVSRYVVCLLLLMIGVCLRSGRCVESLLRCVPSASCDPTRRIPELSCSGEGVCCRPSQ